MKPDRADRVLEAAGRQEMPAPRPEFVRDLEARITGTRVIETPAARRGPWRAVGAAAAAAVVVVGTVVAVQHRATEQRVVTEPASPTTASKTETPTASTATIPPPTTGSGPATTSSSVRPPTTTTPIQTIAPASTAPPPPSSTTSTSTSTTTEPPTTTTTAAPASLQLSCTTSSTPGNNVACSWTASTDPHLDHYRLWKHTGDGPAQEVYAGTSTSHTDTTVRTGERLYYEVTALAADGTVLAHGTAYITCC